MKNKCRCKNCFSSDIIMFEEPEDMDRPYFKCRSCRQGWNSGIDGEPYKSYVIEREKNKKTHERFIYKNFKEYSDYLLKTMVNEYYYEHGNGLNLR